ncbi:MAG: BON domain-containing protein [Acidimicrobiales bacterium]
MGAALWAWQHRDQIAGWAGWVARSAPRLIGGDTKDVVAEGRLRARLTADPRTRDVGGLRVEVAGGVAVLRGTVRPEAHDAAVDIATNSSGVRRVSDELRDSGRRR